MKKIYTTCTRDCPGSCSIEARVDQGKIKSLHGNRKHPITAGFLCINTAHYLQNRFYSHQRILNPLKKVEDSWEQIQWDEALDLAAMKLQDIAEEYGSNSILYYQGFGARTALRLLNNRFFNLMGGVSTLNGTLCGGTGQAGQEMDMGLRISHDPLDHLNSKAIIVWGRNPAVTDIHLWRILLKARKKGTSLVVIDPVKTISACNCDLFLQPKPGSDPYLALAVSRIIVEGHRHNLEFIDKHTINFSKFKKVLDHYSLEELSKHCDVPLEKIIKLANIYASGTSSIIAGWGVHRYYQGHLSLRYMDALAALSGNIGVSGGGVSQGFDEYAYFDEKWKGDELATNSRKIPMPLIGEAILNARNPPIKMIVVTAGNPLAMAPNSTKVKKAFKKVEYCIVMDQVINDTGQEADLFLPTTTFLEDIDLVGSYGHNYISPLNPVVNPRGEARSELWIFQELANRLGFKNEMKGSPYFWLKRIARPVIEKGFILDDLLKKPVRLPEIPFTPYGNKKFLTSSGKFEFVSELPEEDSSKKEYDLHLLSIMPSWWVGSEIPNGEHGKEFLEVMIHPELLDKHGIENGEIIILESPTGKLKVRVNASKNTRKDVVVTYRGGWVKYNKGINVLTRDMISQEGQGTPFYETRVRMKKLVF